ncbi:serine/threonine protein phosphatase PrpC [Variovorax boronicumulans]|uniref:PP2C family protein-serine/threonine phosphatase n=1 Tax=Variovorax boronicumulans TaxID=436515 RepID=UPI002781738E|nr:PP2C family protein-serine/threonine phosphatase [Variovorax boronicumulans]MDP9912399.1 serine/threonine protein phosphatase PrpC [Variovorax boronicumulans]
MTARYTPSEDAVTPLVQHRFMPAPRRSMTGWLRHQWSLVRRPRIESGWASLCGAGHERNQDAVLAADPLFAVADGVGGGSAGELASSQMLAWSRAIQPADWRSPEALAAKLREADAALANALERLSPGGRSATTFAGAWLRRSGHGLVAHVGDSRVMQLHPRPGAWRVTRLTADQTYANLSEVPPEGSRPDDPARMVGVGAIGEPPVKRLRLGENDWLLLSSDGLHRFVSESTLVALCQRDAATPLQEIAQQLAQAAVQAGSRDDISVLLVRRNPLGGARTPFWLALAASVIAALALLGSAHRWQPDATGDMSASPPAGMPSTANSGAPLSPR